MSRKWKAIIIDDEQGCIDALQARLRPFEAVLEVLAGITQPVDMPGAAARYKPDIIFLDINLGPFTGFDLIERMDLPRPRIVFTTAYDQYALKAFRYHALDYLLKPVDELSLAETIDKLRDATAAWPSEVLLEQAVQDWKNPRTGFHKLAVPTFQGFTVLDLGTVIKLEAASNYTLFYLTDGRKITVSRTLKEYDELLSGDGFVRIHASYLINMQHVTGMQKGKSALVRMSDGSQLDIGLTRRDAFMQVFKQYFKLKS